MYDQKGDKDNALIYFMKGLEIKKKSKANDLSLINSMNNVASMYCGLGRTNDAHRMLDEVEYILNRQKVSPGDPVAYLYGTRGLAYMKEGKLNEAREVIEKGVEKRQSLAPDNPSYLESLSHKAEICRLQRDFKACRHTVDMALKVQETVVKAMPQHFFIKECLECLLKVHEELGDTVNYKNTLGKLESELLRLEREIDESNKRKLQGVRSALEDVKLKFDSMEET